MDSDTFVRYLGNVDIVGHAKDVGRHTRLLYCKWFETQEYQ